MRRLRLSSQGVAGQGPILRTLAGQVALPERQFPDLPGFGAETGAEGDGPLQPGGVQRDGGGETAQRDMRHVFAGINRASGAVGDRLDLGLQVHQGR